MEEFLNPRGLPVVITYCKSTRKYVSYQCCILIDPNCTFRYDKTWFKREELEGDKDRPSDDVDIVKKPTVCLHGESLVFRYSIK